ncbi:hypothetical protein CJA_1564 [Cellvibrio japonicus Ueda107]|uniref:Uncharacterized protein n=1 Tax=Cellvibrio japonicus (strain Ueda107) TaxID=498211 RepID=B3PE54_CELJU|nr:hypothetical protein CJA_1564 [Cellvibrio japonicus Ueda107]
MFAALCRHRPKRAFLFVKAHVVKAHALPKTGLDYLINNEEAVKNVSNPYDLIKDRATV